MSILVGSISEQSRDLDGGCSFDAFAASDGEGSGLVGPADAPRALGAVAAYALSSPKGFVPKLGVSNASISDDEKHFASNCENVKPMMRERR